MNTARILAIYLSVAIAFGIGTSARAGTLPDIGGVWYANGHHDARCTISQSGDSVSLTNEQGATATGKFVNAGTIATNWGYLGGENVTGVISTDLLRITWSNGTYWSRPMAPIATPTPVPPPVPQSPSGVSTQTVCKGGAPAGWAVTNDAWNPTRCGSPSKITYNMWTIVRLDSRPVGGTVTICQGYVPIPSNWVIVSTRWVPTQCGQPVQIINNVATIKRVS